MMGFLAGLLSKVSGYVVSLGNPSDRTTELRLIAFGAFVLVGLTMVTVEFWQTAPHHINNTALATMAGACALGALSMRGEQ
jgi:hypothetical protein